MVKYPKFKTEHIFPVTIYRKQQTTKVENSPEAWKHFQPAVFTLLWLCQSVDVSYQFNLRLLVTCSSFFSNLLFTLCVKSRYDVILWLCNVDFIIFYEQYTILFIWILKQDTSVRLPTGCWRAMLKPHTYSFLHNLVNQMRYLSRQYPDVNGLFGYACFAWDVIIFFHYALDHMSYVPRQQALPSSVNITMR